MQMVKQLNRNMLKSTEDKSWSKTTKEKIFAEFRRFAMNERWSNRQYRKRKQNMKANKCHFYVRWLLSVEAAKQD
jgi:lambda repressor-like predicted transcriptional regulator